MKKNKEQEDKGSTVTSDLIERILKDFKGLYHGSRSGDEIKNSEVISTGSFWFDYILNGGFITGTWARFFSLEECGKSSLGLGWGRQWQDYYKKQEKKPYVVYFNSEGRVTKQLLDRVGIDTDKKFFKIIDGNYYEMIFGTIEKMVQQGGPDDKFFFMIDSTDACQKLDDAQKSYSDAPKMAGGAAIASAAGKRLSSLVNSTGHFMFLCSQVRDKMASGMSKGGTAPSGGHAMQFYSSLVAEIKKPWSETLIFENPSDKKSKQIGRMCDIRLVKTPNETTGQRVLVPIKYGLTGGIWRNYEGMMAAQNLNIYRKAGAWWKIDEHWLAEMKKDGLTDIKEAVQGEASLIDYFDGHDELVEYSLTKMKMLFPSNSAGPVIDDAIDDVKDDKKATTTTLTDEYIPKDES